jgi:hypothetical protein
MAILSIRRTTAVVTAVLLGVVLACCGSSEKSQSTKSTTTTSSTPTDVATPTDEASASPDQQASESASQAALGEGPAVTAAPTVPAPTLNAKTMPMRLAEALQRAKSVHFEIPKADFGGMQVSSSGEASLVKADPKAVVNINMMGDWKMVYVDKQTYVKPPMQVPNGRTWLLLSDNDMGMGLSGPMSFLNPTELLLSLQTPGTFKTVGPAVIDGVQTMEYQITMDSQALNNWLKLTKEMRKYMPKKAIVHVWMDANDLPRQVFQTLPVQGQNMSLKMKLSRFGTPVNAVAPPKSQVGSFQMGAMGLSN